MGGARYLKLEGQREDKGQGTWGNNFLRVDEGNLLFSRSVHHKDVAGSRGKAPVQGVREGTP